MGSGDSRMIIYSLLAFKRVLEGLIVVVLVVLLETAFIVFNFLVVWIWRSIL
jgi:hypothetical protein